MQEVGKHQEGRMDMSIIESIQGFMERGRHREMERFSTRLSVLAALLVVILAACFLMQQDQDRTQLGTQAVYTEKMAGSLSGASANVEGVFRNADGTRAMALFKFEDVAKMNTDAAQYKMFVTGANPNGGNEVLGSHPSGAVYVFGSSGYAAVYLTASDGFPSQILDVVLRADRQLGTAGSAANSEGITDASFAKYDQMRMYFNPGAEGVVHAEALDADVLDPKALYEELVSRPQEEEVRETLDDDLEQMRIALNRIDEYTERAERDGLIVPDAPTAIAGDAVEEDEDGNLVLVSDTVVLTGFDYDWRSGSVAEGYIDDLLRKDGAGRSATQYLVDKASEASSAGTGTSEFRIPTDDKWSLISGQSVTSVSGGSDAQYKTYTSDISLLTGAWEEYYQLKKDYQAKHLRELLLLEVDSESAAEGCTVRSDGDVITTY